MICHAFQRAIDVNGRDRGRLRLAGIFVPPLRCGKQWICRDGSVRAGNASVLYRRIHGIQGMNRSTRHAGVRRSGAALIERDLYRGMTFLPPAQNQTGNHSLPGERDDHQTYEQSVLGSHIV